MKPNLAELMLMSSMLEPYGSRARHDSEPVSTKPRNLTGKQWANRKSRNRIAKQSKNRNRK